MPARSAVYTLLGIGLLLGFFRFVFQDNKQIYFPDLSLNWEEAQVAAQQSATSDSLIKQYSSLSETEAVITPDTSANVAEYTTGFLLNLGENPNTPLLPFYQALQKYTDGMPIHIGHYGDSQIEGDRISSPLRKLFQKQFGGKGIGFIPMSDPASVYLYDRKGSLNWKRHTVFQQKLSTGEYGLSGTAFRFERTVIKDSISPDSIRTQVIDGGSAFVHLHFLPEVRYDTAVLNYGKVTDPCGLKLWSGDSLITTFSLTGTELCNTLVLPIAPNSRKVKLEFQSSRSPVFYGINTYSSQGVYLHNFGIRGHSGEGLLKIPSEIIQTQGKPFKLMILQYGNNAIPYLDSPEECKQFEELYYSIFVRLKRLLPETSILVIGVGDMVLREGGKENDYPFLVKFRDAQKSAAVRAGCAFWDLYAAMGGERSLLTWHEQKLASLDGHLSPNGQALIARKLYEDLMQGYQQYLQTQSPSR